MFASYRKHQEKNEQGFTLVEILVVILIIGILAAIAVPLYLNQKKKANDAQLRSDMKLVATWMETNKVKFPNEVYPRFAANWYNPDPAIPPTVQGVPFDVKISPGSGLITSDTSNSGAYFGGTSTEPGAGFCIEGQAMNSNFYLPDNGNRMYYNSLKGGFTNNCRLP